MTIEEIEKQISDLNTLLVEKKKELLKQNDAYVDKYYKFECFDDDNIVIGKIMESNGDKCICDEICFGVVDKKFNHEPSEFNYISEIEIISEEEFIKLYNEMMDKLYRKFFN